MRIGVDLGGTKIEAIALADSGEIVARERVPTPPGYDDCVEAIVGLVTAVERTSGERGTIGIGIPGAVTPSTGLESTSFPSHSLGETSSPERSDACEG